MRIDTKEVREGLHDGEIVWVTHYNTRNPERKPLRNITPTKCIILCNQDVENTKRKKDINGEFIGYPKTNVYYSDSHFAPLSKKGKPLKKVISPVDNTGYRSFCGNMLNVFTTDKEAQLCYDKEYSSFHPKATKILLDIEDVRSVVSLGLEADCNFELFYKILEAWEEKL